jgi:NAD(P)-dependent dehydrogenase (short-subunit alcohol dehydrogenase family)
VQVNLTAPLFWTQLAWQKWMREHGGAIVNISSVGGLSTNAILGVYDVSKAALIHLTKQLAAAEDTGSEEIEASIRAAVK